MRSLFIISGEDLVRALSRAGFHLVSASNGVARLRKESREVEVPLLRFLEEPMIDAVLAQSGLRPLELVSILSIVEDEARWRAAQSAAPTSSQARNAPALCAPAPLQRKKKTEHG